MGQNKINIKNKKASFQYETIEKLTAGIILTGTEIKSIRQGKASLVESYCRFRDNELYITGMHIAEYNHGGYVNHEPARERKLLLNTRELKMLKKGIEQKGLTIVAHRLYINERGLAKLDIALARGKNIVDKREDIKRRDMERSMGRAMKY